MPVITLRGYLCTPNPELQYHVDEMRELSTTETLAREPIEGKDIWDDFDLESINAVFGPLLDQTFLSSRSASCIPSAALRTGRRVLRRFPDRI